MTILEHLVTGHPERVLSTLITRVSALTRYDVCVRFKIGRTSTPEARFAQVDYADYDDMVLVYRTDSVAHADTVEAALVEHNRDRAENERNGGGPIGDPPYFVYVVREMA